MGEFTDMDVKLSARATLPGPVGFPSSSVRTTLAVNYPPQLLLYPVAAINAILPGVGFLAIGRWRLARPMLAWTLLMALSFVALVVLHPGGCGCAAHGHPLHWTKTLWLYALVAGVFVSVTWTFVVGAGLATYWTLKRRYRAMTRAEGPRPSCPRCRGSEREASGWCAACSSELSARPIDPAAPEVLAADIQTRTRAMSASGLVVFPHRVAYSSGESLSIGRRSDRVLRLYSRLSFNMHRAAVESAYRDPDDPSLLWTVRRLAVRGRAGDTLDVRNVCCHRSEAGKSSATWEFAPLA